MSVDILTLHVNCATPPLKKSPPPKKTPQNKNEKPKKKNGEGGGGHRVNFVCPWEAIFGYLHVTTVYMNFKK